MRFNTLKKALKTCSPVILGYLAAGFAFGLMFTSAGFAFIYAVLMSVVIYAGAGQYLAVGFFVNNIGLLQMALMTFLVNSKHLFYGLSLLEEFKDMGRKRPYMIFSLTDETYALLTGTTVPESLDKKKYMFYIAVINQLSWITGTTVGAILGSLIKFNTKGLDFALTALFFVIVAEQLSSFKTKLPFVIGVLSAIAAQILIGKDNMLLGGSLLSVLLLIIFRKRIVHYDQ